MHGTAQTDVPVIRVAMAYVVTLIVFLLLAPLSLYGQLFGPPWTCFIGVLGFASAMPLFGLSRTQYSASFIRACPSGLSDRFTSLKKLEIPLQRAMRVIGLFAFIGLVTLAATARLDGVPGTPVFAHREHYILVDHSVYTEVSRLRYCFAGAGFHVAWHCGEMYAILLAIYALVFARLPKQST
jgi:hypothetical protein